MSFYGDIKRVQSSPYVFDKYYPNRVTMEENVSLDGVYIGRYILVKYTIKDPNDNTTNSQYFNKYVPVENGSTNKKVYEGYKFNADKDLSIYTDTFDGTVWQKIYSQGAEKYILIAELNSAVPRVEFDIVPPKYYTNTTNSYGIRNEELLKQYKLSDRMKIKIALYCAFPSVCTTLPLRGEVRRRLGKPK